MSTQLTSNNSGQPTHSGEGANGMLSDDSRRRLNEAYQRAKSSQPPQDSVPLLNVGKRKADLSHTQQPGFTVDAGRQLTTRKNLPEQMPLSIVERRQRNLQNEQWRIGFGNLMVAISAAFNRPFGVIDLDLWAGSFCEFDEQDLNSGVSEFIQSPEGFPTPGKAIQFIKKHRQRRLGIVIR